MIWDYYFIFDSIDKSQDLRCICKNPEDAKAALEDCYLDNKYNEDFIKQISFCLIFTFDNTTDEYELNKRLTQEFISELSVCKQCNRVKNKLDRNGHCSECESEFVGIDTFQCALCKKKRVVRDEFNRELFGKLVIGDKEYLICPNCAEHNYKPQISKEGVKT